MISYQPRTNKVDPLNIVWTIIEKYLNSMISIEYAIICSKSERINLINFGW